MSSSAAAISSASLSSSSTFDAGSTLRAEADEIEARVRLDRVVSDSPRFVDRGAQDRLRSLELAAPVRA